MIEDGRVPFTNASAACSIDWPDFSAASLNMPSTPFDNLGPGSPASTVTPVPAARLARPREIDRSAVLVNPKWIMSTGIFKPDSDDKKPTRPQFRSSIAGIYARDSRTPDMTLTSKYRVHSLSG